VIIHPADAAQRGIIDGDKVTVLTLRGEVPLWAKVTDAVTPGSVEVNVGGGGPIPVEAWRNANTNVITDFFSSRDFPFLKLFFAKSKSRGSKPK
jgi:anaerobic selenocysteine-containing dehydrogenase